AGGGARVPRGRGVCSPPAAEHGWTASRAVIQTVNADMPFLVDSLTMALTSHGFRVDATIHPIFRVVRAADGTLETIEHGPGNGGGKRESFIHFEIAREADPRVLAAIERRLERTLRDVRTAVSDWPAMLRKLRAAAAELDANTVSPPSDVAEARAFLAWLADDHFTLLGYREYELIPGEDADRLEPKPGTGLGLL